MRALTLQRTPRAGVFAAALAALLTAAVALARAPAVARQPHGSTGCISGGGPFAGGCARGRSLNLNSVLGPLAVSPNGRFVYAVNAPDSLHPRRDNAQILVFARDRASGALRRLPGRAGCLENSRTPVAAQHGPCELVGGIQQPDELVISPDGRRMYATTDDELGDYLTTFALDRRTGIARRLQCLTNVFRSACPQGPLELAYSVAVSPDSRDVYVGSQTAFASGPAPILTVLRAGPDGLRDEQCLAAAPVHGRRCTLVPLIGTAVVSGLAIAPDGSVVYAAVDASGGERVVALRRNAASGRLSALAAPGGCVTDALAPPAGCETVPVAGSSLAISPDGSILYGVTTAAGGQDGAFGVEEFARAASGALAPSACVVFAATAPIGCTAAPAWADVDVVPSFATVPAGLVVGYENPDSSTASAALIGSPPGTFGAADLRGCAVAFCNPLRGPQQAFGTSVAVAPGAGSFYVADGQGIAQLRVVASP